jgi:hypothetical protein
MKKLMISVAALGLAASAAYAQADMSFAEVDTDMNGELSYAELAVAWPDLTQDEFDAADIDMSGGLTADELASIQGAVPAPTDGMGTMEAPVDTMEAPADVTPAEPLSEVQDPQQTEEDDAGDGDGSDNDGEPTM